MRKHQSQRAQCQAKHSQIETENINDAKIKTETVTSTFLGWFWGNHSSAGSFSCCHFTSACRRSHWAKNHFIMSQAQLFLRKSMQKIIYTRTQSKIVPREQYLFSLKSISVCVGTVRDVGWGIWFICLSITGVTATLLESNSKRSKIHEGFSGHKSRKINWEHKCIIVVLES